MHMKWRTIILFFAASFVVFQLYFCALDKQIYAKAINGISFELRINGVYKMYTVKARITNLKSGKTNVYKEKGFDLISDAEVEAIVGRNGGEYLVGHEKRANIYK